MKYYNKYPQDLSIPFALKDEEGNDMLFDDSNISDVRAYVKDEGGNLVRGYAISPDSDETEVYGLELDSDLATAYIWVTKEDMETISNDKNIFIGVEVIITDANVPEDGEINYVELLARITVKRW